MINRNPYAQYQQNQVQTANPEKLILLLYDGAIKFLTQATKAIEDKDIEKTNNYIKRAEDIIAELMTSLNMDIEVSKGLYSLYDYMYYTLIQANIKKDKALVEEVKAMIQDLRETWAQAIVLAKNQQPRVVNGVNFNG